MRKLWHTPREYKTIQDKLDTLQGKYNTLQEQTRVSQGDINCEEAIISDREGFGRVRNSVMQGLRERYGKKIADRALWRVNARKNRGYFQKS